MSDKLFEFNGTVAKCVYSSPSFKTYAFDVDKKEYPDIKFNKYGNVSIIGELSDLVIGAEYAITATEENTKYGVSYRVINIRRDIPTTTDDTKTFLREILTYNQAQVLLENYPDIIELIKNGGDSKVDLTKLHGIGEKTFNVIKRKIVENFKLADIVGEFKGTISLSMIRKIYDKYPDIDILRAKLREEPYTTLTKISGVGFKIADSIVLELQKESIVDFGYDVKTSKDRCVSCVVYLLQQNEDDGNTKMNLADLRKRCLEMIPSSVNHFADAIKSDDIYYSKEDMSIGLRKTYEAEKYIAEMISSNIKTDDVWEYDVEKYREADGFLLSDEQIGAVENLCRYSISILNGAAGSGKSFSTQAIINMLEDNEKNYILLSPTGKSAKVLAEYTGRKASTIHRGLGYNPAAGWYYNDDNRLPYDVVIVDECSMVDVNLFTHLIRAVDFSETRLMLIGDSAQLPSVGCGNLFHDFMKSRVIPTTTLTKIFRYSEGGLMMVATDTRFCNPYLDKSMKGKATKFGSNKDYTFIDIDSESMTRNVVAIYKKLVDGGTNIEDVQVLTAKNVGDCGTIMLNDMIQKAVNKNYGNSRFMKVGNTVYFDGDIVMQTQNNYKAEMCDDTYRTLRDGDNEPMTAFVANGETAAVKYACKDYVVMDFDGILIKYDRAAMNMISLAYAISIFKAQGSSIKNVILCTPRSHSFMLNNNLIYTGLTRTSGKCFHLGSLQTVNSSVKKKANLTRKTFMQELLLKAAKMVS